MIKINTEKCEKCAHNDICKNTGYIDKLIELHKMIEYKAEFCTININLMCEYYKDEKSAAPISWPTGVRGIEVFDTERVWDKSPDDFTKACNCALPTITGSTECCKNCNNLNKGK